jgi:flagellar hook protein FlgE
MLGAINIGLSGMDAYSQGLQIISNNIANLDTLGYKADNVTFSDFYNDSNGSNSSNTTALGSMSDGDGVRLGSPSIDFSQGTLQSSSGNLDMGIQGDGFLMLQNADNQTFYARTGQFTVDSKGYVSINNGALRLMVLDPTTHQPVVAQVDTQKVNPPAATTKVTFTGNLSSTGTSASVSNITVYDAAGGQHTWNVQFAAAGSSSPGQWNVTVTDETGATIATSTLTFNGNVIDPTTATINVTANPAGAPAMNVALDFSQNVTSYSAGTSSTIATDTIDGRGVGQYTGVTLDSSGTLQVGYSNNQTVALGAVAIANFQDPQQLVHATGAAGLFTADPSVRPDYQASGSPGVGTLATNQVEASNVDLTTQFGDLILIQRGYQASSQVVSVANDMIQQLFGIRGQQ